MPAVRSPAGVEEPPRAGPILVFWMILTLGLQASLWISGARTTGVSHAIERGAAKVETRGVGEVGDEVVRKAIGIQHDTLPFWVTILALGDFAGEPLAMALRAGMAATLFAGLALLRGRPVEFGRGLVACSWAQGFWVLGLAVHAALTIALRRPEIETSAVLFLPPGTHEAVTWAVLRQVEVFAMLGWLTMISGAWQRGQVGLLGATIVGVSLFLIEAAVRLQFSLLIEAGMRLSLMPEV